MAKKITYQIDIDRGSTRGADALRDTERTVESLDRELRQAARSAKSLDSALEQTGGADFGRAGGGAERVLRGLGGGASSELLGLAGDIGDVVEALGSDGGLKGVLAGLVSPAGMLTVGLGAAGLAVSAFTAILEQQRVSAEAAAAQLVAAARSQETYAQLLERSGTAAIESARAEQVAAFEVTAAAVEALKLRREELQLIVDSQRARGTFLTQEQSDLDAINAEYEKHADALYGVNENILILNDLMSGTEFAAKKAAEGFKQLTGFIDAGRNAVSDIGGVVTGVLDTISDMAEQTAEDAAAAFAKLQQTTQDAVDKLNSDRGALSAELRATVDDLNAALIAAQRDADADINAARAEAHADALQAEQQYQRDAERAAAQHQRDLTRLTEDANADIEDAIRSGNFAQARNIQQDRDRERKRLEEDYQVAADQRAADFAARAQAEAAALASTIAGIERQRDAELEALRLRIVAEQAAYDAAILEIDRLKQAHLDQISAVAEANRARYAEEEKAIKSVADQWKAMTYYYGGQLHTTPPPAAGGIPAPAAGVLPMPDPDPYDLAFGPSKTTTSGASVSINTAGLFNGAVFGAPSILDMNNAIAYAQQQIAQAMALVFQYAQGAA